MKSILAAGAMMALAFAGTGIAQAQVKFGVGGPMTGANAAFGEQLRRGAEQAVKDINAAGGILGQQVMLSSGDDASDPRQGVSVANKFASEGVKFVVGHFNSGVSIPASDVYAENNILQITPASTNPRFTERKLWNVFRTCGRDDQQGAVAADFILKKMKGTKIAIVHDKTPYGKGLADAMKENLNKGSVTEVLYEGINTGEKDFSALVSKIKAAEAGIVYFGGLFTEGGLIVRQMRDQGVKASLMAGDGITSKEFWQVAGPGAEGTYMTYGPDPRKNPAAKAAVERFTAQKIDPESYTLYAYAAVQAVAEAAKRINSLDTKKIAEELRAGKPFETVLGPLDWDSKGDITKLDYVMYVWKNGNYEEM
jgi:branched-chain amino acid transport system substrate-binding protein